MSDQRILSADELIGILVCMDPEPSAFKLRDHIAALTEQHAAMKEANKCGSCSGTGWIAETYSTSETGWGCSACDGTGNKLHAQARELARVTKERDEAVNDLTQATLGFALRVKHLQAEITNAKQVHAMLRGQYDGMRTELRLNNEMHEAELAAMKAERAEDTARLDKFIELMDRSDIEAMETFWDTLPGDSDNMLAEVRTAIDAARAAGKEGE